MINGRGPFRLVLDTGASHSAITALVALALGIPTDRSPPVILRGVTGFATVPTIRVDTLSIGDVAVDQAILPIDPPLAHAPSVPPDFRPGGQTPDPESTRPDSP